MVKNIYIDIIRGVTVSLYSKKRDKYIRVIRLEIGELYR